MNTYVAAALVAASDQRGRQAGIRSIWSQLGSRQIEELVELPLMTTRTSNSHVLAEVVTPALFTDENLLALVICRMVNLSIEHGNSDGSSFAYVWFAIIAWLPSATTRTDFVLAGSAMTWSKYAG